MSEATSGICIFPWTLHIATLMRSTCYAVSASGTWRITFGWIEGEAIDVDLEDYY
jgi:plasmid maintenance system killer protein